MTYRKSLLNGCGECERAGVKGCSRDRIQLRKVHISRSRIDRKFISQDTNTLSVSCTYANKIYLLTRLGENSVTDVFIKRF